MTDNPEAAGVAAGAPHPSEITFSTTSTCGGTSQPSGMPPELYAMGAATGAPGGGLPCICVAGEIELFGDPNPLCLATVHVRLNTPPIHSPDAPCISSQVSTSTLGPEGGDSGHCSPAMQIQELLARAASYFAMGGLWNPDLMAGPPTADLIRDLSAALARLQGRLRELELQNEELRNALARLQPTATHPSDVHAETAEGDT